MERVARLRTSVWVVVALALLAMTLAACGAAGPAAGSPAAVVQAALDRLAAKDVTGLRTLACAGQENLIRDQLGIPGAIGPELLPGLDTQAVVDAVNLDTSKVHVGDSTVDGDIAQVPVTGDLGVTFDATRMRPILKQVMAAQGTTMTDEQLDALLKTLDGYGQAVPVDQSIRLILESGAWKICQQTIATPAP